MMDPMAKALALTAILTLVACSSSAQQNDAEIVAKIGDRTITTKEMEDRWQKDEPGDRAEALQKVYDGRRGANDAILADMLFADAAKSKGLSAAAYEQAEVSRRAKPVSDTDVESFYKANLNEMQGRPLETMGPLIRRFLEEQARTAARQELIADLRKSGPGVHVLLDPPRRTVEVAATDPSRGSASAPVTIIEFSDFQCPYCQRVRPTLRKLQDAYGDRVRIVWKDYPLTQIHPLAFKAAEAAHCAADQGKFWEYHDRLFADQRKLEVDDLKHHAADMSLDTATFNACLDTSKYAERVRDGVAQGNRLGVSSTPTIYVNGRMLAGAYPYETFVSIIDEELDRAKQ
jgi:protein-disulfide isomerase